MNNLLDTKECRICLSDDVIQNMISPCLCIGTNKYVHEECLKNFIILSDNQLFKKECYICKYEYKFEIKDIDCNNYTLLLFIINILLTFIVLIYIYYNILNLFFSFMITLLIVLPFIINLIFFKRKYILLKLYLKEYMCIPIVLLSFGLYLLQYEILNIYGFYLENISIFMIWNIHHKCINKLNKFEHFKILSINNV